MLATASWGAMDKVRAGRAFTSSLISICRCVVMKGMLSMCQGNIQQL